MHNKWACCKIFATRPSYFQKLETTFCEVFAGISRRKKSKKFCGGVAFWQILVSYLIPRIPKSRDKHKEKGILLERNPMVKSEKGWCALAENSPEMLNSVYKEISEKLGIDAAMEIYRMFRGQQISFPMRFFNPVQIQKRVLSEYDGTNIKILAMKYGYSEKTVRRIIRDRVSE